MNMKVYLLLPAFLLMAIGCAAQQTFPFFARTSEAFMNPVRDWSIKNVRIDNGNMLYVKKAKGSETYNVAGIFGYRNKRGNAYRIYNGEEYEVLAAGELCVYAHPVLVLNLEVGGMYPVLKYYFSRRIDGTIYELNRDNIALVFEPANARFVTLIKQCRFDADLTRFDHRNHAYNIEEIYQQSKDSDHL
jgi:hypothetical protein